MRMTKEELGTWAADNWMVEQDSEGSPAEALMAGWVYAMDADPSDEAEFVAMAYSQFDNMGYTEV